MNQTERTAPHTKVTQTFDFVQFKKNARDIDLCCIASSGHFYFILLITFLTFLFFSQCKHIFKNGIGNCTGCLAYYKKNMNL